MRHVRIPPLLKHDDTVGFKVGETGDVCAPWFRLEKPSHVGIEKPPLNRVRVLVRIAVEVVKPVVAHPVVNRPLVGNRIREHEKDADRQRCGIGPV
jgi:hypothetical protein